MTELVAQTGSSGVRSAVLVLQSTALGGMESHVADLATELVRRQIAVDVVIPDGPAYGQLSSRMSAGGARVYRFRTDGMSGRFRQAGDLLRLAFLLLRRRPDVVHLHTGGATGGLAVIALSRLMTRRATVITEHDVPSEKPDGYQRSTRSAVDRYADAVVAVSRRNASLRTQRIPLPASKQAVILNGAPTADLPDGEVRAGNRAGLRAQLGLDRDALVFGSLVRLAEGKGLVDLLRAFAVVRRQLDCNLVLVGDGPLRQQLEALAGELEIGQHVRFAGHQTSATRFLDAMDVFVLAVPAGSMSMALLEAMARGVPSVITYCGPEEPVIDDVTGLCAPPSNSEGLARVLARIGGDQDLRASLGEAGRLHVLRNFSVNRVADDLLDLYAVCRTGRLPDRLRATSPSPMVAGLVADPSR